MNPKDFALQAIASYYRNPETCGIDTQGFCAYLTIDGRMCVLGKYLLYSYVELRGTAESILEGKNQEEVLVPEAVGILTTTQWKRLQSIHDNIACNHPIEIVEVAINNLNLFTLEELKNYNGNKD